MKLKWMINSVNSIGYHGPYILFMMSLLFIITSTTKTVKEIGIKSLILVIWNLINIWLNGTLKKLIKQSRPKNPITINNQDVINSKSYGMPSGHAQIAMTNLIFLSLVTRNLVIIIMAAFQTLLTLYQRYAFRMHSASQLIAGTIIGGISGYLLYIIMNCIDDKDYVNDKKNVKHNI